MTLELAHYHDENVHNIQYKKNLIEKRYSPFIHGCYQSWMTSYGGKPLMFTVRLPQPYVCCHHPQCRMYKCMLCMFFMLLWREIKKRNDGRILWKRISPRGQLINKLTNIINDSSILFTNVIDVFISGSFLFLHVGVVICFGCKCAILKSLVIMYCYSCYI